MKKVEFISYYWRGILKLVADIMGLFLLLKAFIASSMKSFDDIWMHSELYT